jgi:phosphoglycerate dehydrogenase-like enzyme
MSSPPGIAIVPAAEEGLVGAVTEGGARVVEPEDADGIVWTNPGDPEGLRDVLMKSPARWVQLPFAGIESFFAAGVIDADRTWTCTKGAYGPACAEHALGLILAGARRLHHHARAREWVTPGFGSPERRLEGATVLIVGTGGIGGALAQMLGPLKVRILGVNRSGNELAGAERTVTVEHLADVIKEADFVAVTAALTPATRGLFDRAMLDRMRPGAWLINVARGGLVVTADLVDVLGAGIIGGAALDVTDPEPLPHGHPLWDMDNVLITPHIANTWDMALPELRAMVKRNVAHFAAGEQLEGLVDAALGY